MQKVIYRNPLISKTKEICLQLSLVSAWNRRLSYVSTFVKDKPQLKFKQNLNR